MFIFIPPLSISQKESFFLPFFFPVKLTLDENFIYKKTTFPQNML